MKHLMVNDKEYQEHAVFNELSLYIEFYEDISFSVFPWVTVGTEATIGNVDTYIFSSIKGTLSSIRRILKDGRINDAYALLRKYYDSIIINIYSILYLKNEFSIQNFVVEQINNWLKGRDKLPEYRIMSRYIRSSGDVAQINSLIYSDETYKKIRDRCNDNTHYNFYKNALYNDNEIYIEGRYKLLNGLSSDARNLFIFHLSYLFSIKENYMMSSDYRDALDCGIEPECDSQYWVAPFIQEIFSKTIATHRPDIAELIRKNTCMHLT